MLGGRARPFRQDSLRKTPSWAFCAFALPFSKPGVGLVLDAGAPSQLSQIAVTTDTPGFTAEIRAGNSAQGPFDTVVGPSRTVSDGTTWDLNGPKLQHYVIWITQLERVAHINEVKAN